MDCFIWTGSGRRGHVAAVLYGIGARLDEQPELLFTLRQVDHLELIEGAGAAASLPGAGAGGSRNTLADGELADVFGIELAEPADAPPPKPAPKKRLRAGKAAGAAPTRKSSAPEPPPAAKPRKGGGARDAAAAKAQPAVRQRKAIPKQSRHAAR